MIDYTKVVTTSVAQQIAERLREAIVKGHIKPSERLPSEEELAKSYGVSRTTVRESLKRLAAQNLVRSRRGPTGGNFVVGPTPGEIGQALTEATTLMMSAGSFQLPEISTTCLETMAICCSLAAKNHTEQDLSHLRAALARQADESLTDEQYSAADVRFYRAIVNATNTPPLSFVMYAIVEGMLPILNIVESQVRERRVIVGFHTEIVAAIERRDAEAAVAKLRELVAYHRRRHEAARRASKRAPEQSRSTERERAADPTPPRRATRRTAR